MAVSQNGYKANDRSLIATYPVPGAPDVRLPLRAGDVAYVLLWAASRWHREVEPLRPGWCWGYAERTIRGDSDTLSNHASGTAEDFNAPAHPLGTQPSSTMSSRQIAAARAIIRDARVSGRPVLRWGGDYTGRKDTMHLEIVGSPADVAALAARLRGELTTPKVPTQRQKVQQWQTLLEFAPSRRDGIFGPDTLKRSTYMRNAALYRSRIARSTSRPTMELIQRIVDTKPDGAYGPNTDRAITAWTVQAQRFLGVKADGAWGPVTDAAYRAFVRASRA